jgi:hypothetical protein
MNWTFGVFLLFVGCITLLPLPPQIATYSHTIRMILNISIDVKSTSIDISKDTDTIASI